MCLQALIGAGADVNTPRSLWFCSERGGHWFRREPSSEELTPLLWAVTLATADHNVTALVVMLKAICSGGLGQAALQLPAVDSEALVAKAVALKCAVVTRLLLHAGCQLKPAVFIEGLQYPKVRS